MKVIESHRRINNSLLSPLERPVLLRLSALMPSRVTPDKLTALAFFAALIIMSAYILTHLNHSFLWLASFGFALHWFGDSLDGTLARYRRIERPRYGFFIDHGMDSICLVLIALGAGLSPYVRLDTALLALTGYLLISIFTYLDTCVEGNFHLSYARLGPTEARLVFIAVNAFAYFAGIKTIRLWGNIFTWYDLILWGAALLLFVMSLVVFGREVLRLRRLDMSGINSGCGQDFNRQR